MNGEHGSASGPVVLVTGGTGTLGRAVVRTLLEGGHTVRVLSRRPRPKPSAAGAAPPGPETNVDPEADDRPAGGDARPAHPGTPQPQWATCDLVSGEGLDDAVAGAGAVVHCATTGTRKDVDVTCRLIESLQRAGGRPHLIYISIVGADRVPFFYYRAKVQAEELVEGAGLPWTILRATQFHDLIARLTTAQRRLPVALFPAGFSFQPVDVREVAEHLAELTLGEPAGRVADMGGPEVRTARELALMTLDACGRRRPLVPLPLAGKAARAYKAGQHLTPGRAVGRTTYAQYLRDAVRPTGLRRGR